jgi:hypothetical protein
MVSSIDNANGLRPSLLRGSYGSPQNPLAAAASITTSSKEPLVTVFHYANHSDILYNSPERMKESYNAFPFPGCSAPVRGRPRHVAFNSLPAILLNTSYLPFPLTQILLFSLNTGEELVSSVSGLATEIPSQRLAKVGDDGRGHIEA